MKPRVLIVNKFYYPRGGDCVCAIALERMLSAKGYTTAVFAMQYPMNIESEWSSYFAPEVSFSSSFKGKLKAAQRMMGHGDLRRSFARILNDFKPDVVHLHNIHSYLSPQLAVMAKEAGCRVVWTMHDYKLVCPSYSCLSSGNVCEDCVGKTPAAVYKKRCMKNSRTASLLAYLEAKKWNPVKLQQYVDAFICPGVFMKKMMLKGGYPEEKLHVNCNYVDMTRFSDDPADFPADADPYYCFVGRLSIEKGVETLLEAASTLPYRLKIAGGGPLSDELREKYGRLPQVEFLGNLDGAQVGRLLRHAHCSVIPSTWYENNPLSVIESLSMGTPVVGSDIGGIPELINNGVTGLLARPGDSASLKQAIDKAFSTEWNRDAIMLTSRERFSADAHLSRLEKIYR